MAIDLVKSTSPFESSTQRVGAALTLIAELHIGRAVTITLNVECTALGGGNIDQFEVMIRAHDNAGMETWLSAADWAPLNENGRLIFCPDTGPHEVNAGDQTTVVFTVPAAHAICLHAASQAVSTVIVRGTFV